MSEIMRGVLNMPPELWNGTPLDVAQRHSIYRAAWEEIESLRQQLAEVQPSALKEKLRCADDRINELEQQLAEARAEIQENEGVINVWRRRCQEAEARAGRVPVPGFDEHGLQFAKEIRHMIQTEDAIGWRREHDQFILDAIAFYTSPLQQPPAGGVVPKEWPPLNGREVVALIGWPRNTPRVHLDIIYPGTTQIDDEYEYRPIYAMPGQPQQEVGK